LAIEDKKLDQAERLFNEGLQLNPSDPEAKAGIQVIEKLRDGRLKREDLEAQLRQAEANAVRIDKEDKAGAKPKARRLDTRLDLVALNQQGQAQPPAEQQQNLLQEQKRLQAVEDQRATAQAEDSIRQAGRLLRSDPDGAMEILRRNLENARTNPGLSEAT